MAKRTKKPQPRPVLPEKLQASIDQKRTEGALRAEKPTGRSMPHRQGASRGPRG